MPAGGPHRVVLVEDHPIVRVGLRAVIGAQPDLAVAGEAETAGQAVALTRRLDPDLVILALRLQGEFQGIEVCREIKSLPAAPAVLVYSSFNSSEDISSSFLSGADSFVYKGAEPEWFLAGVRDTLKGRRVWMTGAEAPGRAQEVQQRAAGPDLTAREREVLGLMLQHYANSAIAQELHIELPTVKTHVRSILRKLGLASRRELF